MPRHRWKESFHSDSNVEDRYSFKSGLGDGVAPLLPQKGSHGFVRCSPSCFFFKRRSFVPTAHKKPKPAAFKTQSSDGVFCHEFETRRGANNGFKT